MVIRPASSGPLLPNPGRPSAYLFLGSRPPPAGRARHPGRETSGRTFRYPPSDAGPTPFVVSRPGVFEEPVLSLSKESCRTTSPQHPTFRANRRPHPFVVSRHGVPCRTTQPPAPNRPQPVPPRTRAPTRSIRTGKSSRTTDHTMSRSTPKYRCTIRLRIPVICDHGISG